MTHLRWLSAFFPLVAYGFYLPGVAPSDYLKGDQVPLTVNALSSTSSALPYDYYHDSLRFCRPKEGLIPQPESIGSILFGDRIFNSPFEIKMMNNVSCQLLCSATYNPSDASFVNNLIKENYIVNWLVDSLPVARKKTVIKTLEVFYSIGFELGQIVNGDPILYNHFDLILQYHTEDENTYNVVGALINPLSLDIKLDGNGNPRCGSSPYQNLPLNQTANNLVYFTYSVTWVNSPITWATRWDAYLHVYDPQIHWFSLVNSIVIVLFLTGMVAMILLRALNKDISRYNQIESQEDPQEDFGWKLVYGDIFRTPRYPNLLSVMIGNGCRLFLMTAVTLVFAVFGFLSPSNRGSLVNMLIAFYVIFSYVAGYASARLYKMMGGESWKRNTLLTAFLLPGGLLGIFVLLNFFLIGASSSDAIPFGTLVALITMWFVFSVPLSLLGSYLGFKKQRFNHPLRVNQIPRQIPDQVFYLKPIPSMLVGGVLPFGAIFIELYFIMSSLWSHKIYYVFGFLFLVFLVLTLTCAEVSILMCYFHLCAEDYHWWWRSFFTSGASAFYVFLYSVLYYFTKLDAHTFSNGLLFFGWSLMMSSIIFIITGTIGFFSCLMFVRKIYSSIKID